MTDIDVRASLDARRTLAGAASALLGLGAAELLALVLPGSTSPTEALASRIIEVTPDGPREALISVVGTADKPLLVVGIVLVTVVAGALLGRLLQPRQVPWAFGLGAALVWGLTFDAVTRESFGRLVVLAVGAAVGSVAWHRLTRGVPSSGEAGSGVLDRRTFLSAAAIVAVAGAAGLGIAAAGRRGSAAAVDAARSAVRLLKPTEPAPPLPAGATPDVSGLAPAVTANEDFYQIDVSIVPPSIDTADWSMTVDGSVATPLTLTYADLLAMPSIERRVALTCVSNEVGGDLVGNALWQGVRLRDLLDRVGVQPTADAVVGESVDGFTAGFPLSVLDDGRDAMVAYAMNGEPLPVKHGFPARLVVPGLYGYVSATKWLRAIHLTTLQETVPFWLQRGWSVDGTIEIASRIDVPRDGADVRVGRVRIGGRAWHQHRGIAGVQLRIDGGDWVDATLAADIGTDAWRLWSYAWDAAAGSHSIEVRATSLDGTVQSADERPVFPGASSGLHRIGVTAG